MEIEFTVYNLVFIMKMTVYCFDSCVSRGAPAPFHFVVGGFRVDVVNLNHSWCFYSRRHISPKPFIYVDIWIYFYNG